MASLSGKTFNNDHDAVAFVTLHALCYVCDITQVPVRWTHLSDTQSVGQDPVHRVGLHLSPLQLEAVDAGFVLPQSAVRVVVKLRSVGLP